jgi:hypothetical protein
MGCTSRGIPRLDRRRDGIESRRVGGKAIRIDVEPDRESSPIGVIVVDVVKSVRWRPPQNRNRTEDPQESDVLQSVTGVDHKGCSERRAHVSHLASMRRSPMNSRSETRVPGSAEELRTLTGDLLRTCDETRVD